MFAPINSLSLSLSLPIGISFRSNQNGKVLATYLGNEMSPFCYVTLSFRMGVVTFLSYCHYLRKCYLCKSGRSKFESELRGTDCTN